MAFSGLIYVLEADQFIFLNLVILALLVLLVDNEIELFRLLLGDFEVLDEKLLVFPIGIEELFANLFLVLVDGTNDVHFFHLL